MSTLEVNSLIHLDASANNLDLDSSGNATVNGNMTATQFYGGGGNLTGVGVDGIVSTANATAITIDSGEKVGIGTGSPDSIVEIEGTSPVLTITDTDATGANFGIWMREHGSHGMPPDVTAYGAFLNYDMPDNGFQIQMRNGTTTHDALTITRATGNVGIGTTAPVKEFEVRGDSAKIGLRNSITDSGELGVTFCHDNSGGPVKTGIISKSNGNWGRSDLHFVVDSVSDGNAFNISADTKLQITNDGRGLSQFTAKAWCNFAQNTHTIMDSHNISSVTDSGVGNSRVHFSNNLANANYAAIGSAAPKGGSHNDNIAVAYDAFQSVSTMAWLTYRASTNQTFDADRMFSVYFGD